MKYVINSETYEKHIRDEVHLYGLLHQLAFLAGKVKDAEDMANLVETAKQFPNFFVYHKFISSIYADQGL